jgi:hypothetical protein
MEPPHLVTRPSKVVGGERASIAHPWSLWGVERLFADDKAKEYVEQRFLGEHTAHQLEEVWKLRHAEPGQLGMVGMEDETPSPGIQ